MRSNGRLSRVAYCAASAKKRSARCVSTACCWWRVALELHADDFPPHIGTVTAIEIQQAIQCVPRVLHVGPYKVLGEIHSAQTFEINGEKRDF